MSCTLNHLRLYESSKPLLRSSTCLARGWPLAALLAWQHRAGPRFLAMNLLLRLMAQSLFHRSNSSSLSILSKLMLLQWVKRSFDFYFLLLEEPNKCVSLFVSFHRSGTIPCFSHLFSNAESTICCKTKETPDSATGLHWLPSQRLQSSFSRFQLLLLLLQGVYSLQKGLKVLEGSTRVALAAHSLSKSVRPKTLSVIRCLFTALSRASLHSHGFSSFSAFFRSSLRVMI